MYTRLKILKKAKNDKENTILKFASILLLVSTNMFAVNSEKVYVSINGHDITASDIAASNPQVQFEILSKDKQRIFLQQLVQRELLGNRALQSDTIKTKEYKDKLKKTMRVLKQGLALQIWLKEVSQSIKITNKDIQEYFKHNQDVFTKGPELKASHILVNTEDEAKKIIQELKRSKDIKKTFTN